MNRVWAFRVLLFAVAIQLLNAAKPTAIPSVPCSGTCDVSGNMPTVVGNSGTECTSCFKQTFSKGYFTNKNGGQLLSTSITSCMTSVLGTTTLVIGNHGTSFKPASPSLPAFGSGFSGSWSLSAGTQFGQILCNLTSAIGDNGTPNPLSTNLSPNSCNVDGSKTFGTQLLAALLNVIFDLCTGQSTNCHLVPLYDLVYTSGSCSGHPVWEVINAAQYVISGATGCPSSCPAGVDPALAALSPSDLTSCLDTLNAGPYDSENGGSNIYSQNGNLNAPACSSSPYPTPTTKPTYLQTPTPIKTPTYTHLPSATPTLTPSQTPTPGQVFGDPHVRTFDGLAVTYVNGGDHIMAQSMDPRTGFMWQARFCYRGTEAASFTCATALRCDAQAEVVEVYALKDKIHVYIAERLITPVKKTVALKGASLSWDGKTRSITVQCAQGSRLIVDLRTVVGNITYLDVHTNLANSMLNNVNGLLGIWNSVVGDDISDRSGSVWNPGHGLDYVNGVDHPSVATMQASWLVRKGESLFSLSPLKSDASFVPPSRAFRLRQVLQARPSGQEMRIAREVCTNLGMTGPWVETCAFDAVMMHFDSGFIHNHVRAIKRRT